MIGSLCLFPRSECRCCGDPLVLSPPRIQRGTLLPRIVFSASCRCGARIVSLKTAKSRAGVAWPQWDERDHQDVEVASRLASLMQSRAACGEGVQ
jgi:hypothetical protein